MYPACKTARLECSNRTALVGGMVSNCLPFFTKSIIDCSLCTCPILQQKHETFPSCHVRVIDHRGRISQWKKGGGYLRKRVPRVHCCRLAFTIKKQDTVSHRVRAWKKWKRFWILWFQLTGDIMGCNITKMCTIAKTAPKFNCLVALKLLQLLQKSDCQNKNISVNSAQENLDEATLYCMKEHSSVAFSMVERGQSSDVVTSNGYDT